jgi:hypothetical protein
MTWSQMVAKWIDAGALYQLAVIYADEWEKDLREVNVKHERRLIEYRSQANTGVDDVR